MFSPPKADESPDEPLTVEELLRKIFEMQLRSLQVGEARLAQQRITNLHLAKLTGENFTELDIEPKDKP